MSKSFIRCLLRNLTVEATPEELVRQRLILHMVNDLGFSKGGFVIEKSLKQFPHLAIANCEIPDRRVDIAYFCKGIHPKHEVFPLLLIECKAVKLTLQTINQVSGYNHFVKAPYIAVANEEEIRTGWIDQISDEYQYVPYLPKYEDLLQTVKKFAD